MIATALPAATGSGGVIALYIFSCAHRRDGHAAKHP
jgi:hypothetical protein